MEIHLSKPGGQREGPYTLEEINRDLAARKYNDSDYWAWYEGLEAWVPLYSIPGVLESGGKGAAATVADAEEPSIPTEVQSLQTEASATHSTTNAAVAEAPKLDSAAPAKSAVSSGLPFAALEQIFIFTNGEGPSVTHSSVTTVMLQEIIGAEMNAIRERVPRDVFGRCDIGEQVRRDGAVPSSAWTAMSALRPAIVREARAGGYRACVRTFLIESGEAVAVFLFYNKQKM